MSTSDEINATAASLLGFLTDSPMTGWELSAAVEGSIANFWNVTRSQVYRELRTLAELGLVEAGEAGPRDRRPYSITEAGRAAFGDWIVRDPGSPIVRLPLLLTVFFGRHLPPERLAEIIGRELEGGAEALDKFEAMQQEYGSDPFVRQVLQFGIDYQKTLLAWLDGLATDPTIQPQKARTPGRE
ncbi:MAG TPA: PadR family transcriptional regulator [Actinomycetota bacterium]|jgi:DNA-binding PadR family transcriptional regulator|nr:PadR family transcriptional regulator [Actinomycetota bacterium]